MISCDVSVISVIKQESPAVARKPCDAAAVLFALRVAKLRKPRFRGSELQTYQRKTEFNAKWPFKVTFLESWKGDKGLSNTKY